jgi:prepilin-type N-terminal cleavage/methylation domain-containing protein
MSRGTVTSNAGFTLIEMLVVLVVLAIVAAIAIPTINRAATESDDSRLPAAAERMWDGAQAWRLDHDGMFPTAAELTPGALRDVGGAPLVRSWPNDPQTEQPLTITASQLLTPPLKGAPRSVTYASQGATAWIAVYSRKGRLIWTREVAATEAP